MRYVLLLAPALLGFAWADLRPKEVKKADSVERTDRQNTGKALLIKAAEAHGYEAWSTFESMHVVAEDTWRGGASWWPTKQQRFRAERALGTFTSRIELLDGPEAGDIWGLQDWRPYRHDPAVFTESDTAIEFYLPTLQYFDELPFRLLTAEHTLAAGRSKSGHDRVFVTWGELKANEEVDHYVVYLDPTTHRIDRVSYTIREARDFTAWPMKMLMKPLAVGTIHFRDVRNVEGVWLSFDQIVTLGDGETSKDPTRRAFHRVRVEEIGFDTVDMNALRPDLTLPLGSDAKP